MNQPEGDLPHDERQIVSGPQCQDDRFATRVASTQRRCGVDHMIDEPEHLDLVAAVDRSVRPTDEVAPGRSHHRNLPRRIFEEKVMPLLDQKTYIVPAHLTLRPNVREWLPGRPGDVADDPRGRPARRRSKLIYGGALCAQRAQEPLERAP